MRIRPNYLNYGLKKNVTSRSKVEISSSSREREKRRKKGEKCAEIIQNTTQQ